MTLQVTIPPVFFLSFFGWFFLGQPLATSAFQKIRRIWWPDMACRFGPGPRCDFCLFVFCWICLLIFSGKEIGVLLIKKKSRKVLLASVDPAGNQKGLERVRPLHTPGEAFFCWNPIVLEFRDNGTHTPNVESSHTSKNIQKSPHFCLMWKSTKTNFQVVFKYLIYQLEFGLLLYIHILAYWVVSSNNHKLVKNHF